MNKITARRVADSLTWARVVSSVPITILALLGLRWWVVAVYVAAALTDVFDGVYAQRATTAGYGADFDGRADVFFAVMTLIWILILIPNFYQVYWFPYLPAFVALQGYLIIARLREPVLVLPHLSFGRFAVGLFSTLLPVLIVFGDVPWFVTLVLLSSIAAKAQLAWYVVMQQRRIDAV